MKKIIFSLFLVCFLSCSWSASQPKIFPSSLQEQFKKTIDSCAKTWKVPGIGVIVITKKQPTFMHFYGVNSLKEKKKVDADTLWSIASCTKRFTAILIAKAIQEGRLNLNDLVTKYKKNLHLSDLSQTHLLTIDSVLTQRMGVRSFAGDSCFKMGFSQEEYEKAFAKLPLTSKVGTKYGYQNYAYALLGYILEDIYKKPYEDILKENLLIPLNMHKTFIGPSSSAFDRIKQFFHLDSKTFATPHTLDENETVTEIPFNRFLDQNYPGSSGVFICAKDLEKWLKFNLEGNETILNKKFFAHIQTHGYPMTINPDKKNYHFPIERIDTKNDMQYGYGVFILNYGIHGKKVKVYTHMGSNSGLRSFFAIIPEWNMGIVIVSNLGSTLNMCPEAIAYWLFDKILETNDGHDHNQVPYNDLLQKRNISREALSFHKLSDPQPLIDLKTVVGEYENKILGIVTIALKNDQLTMHCRGKKIPLSPWNGSEFRFDPLRLSLSFDATYPGIVTFGAHKNNNKSVLSINLFSSDDDGLFYKK